jgi:hypothetical protein
MKFGASEPIAPVKNRNKGIADLLWKLRRRIEVIITPRHRNPKIGNVSHGVRWKLICVGIAWRRRNSIFVSRGPISVVLKVLGDPLPAILNTLSANKPELIRIK